MTAALRDASIVAANIPIEDEDKAIALEKLNDILTHWQAKLGINLWRETEALLPLNAGQSEYSLGVDGDHCFTDYTYMYTTASYVAGDDDLAVNSSLTDFEAGDNIGVELADGTRFWTTVAGFMTETSIQLVDPLPSSVNQGASIYVYATLIDRPIRILDVRSALGHDEDEMPVNQVSRQHYYRIPNKNNYENSNDVNEWYYSPQLDLGKLSVWPPSTGRGNIVRFTFVKPQYIPESESENILIPSEWYLALKWALASELAVTYAVSPDRVVMIENKAAISLDAAMSGDVEIESFCIQPDFL